MASSKVQICNYALSLLGQDPITSLSESKRTARYCNTLYDFALKETLEDHFWNFAMKRATLAQLASNPLYEYSHQYQLPSDYIRSRRINGDPAIKWVEQDGKLLTDRDSVDLEYIYLNEDPSSYSPTFIEALAHRLAGKLAYPLTQSRTMARDMVNWAESIAKNARSLDGQTGHMDSLSNDEIVDSRFGIYSSDYKGIDTDV